MKTADEQTGQNVKPSTAAEQNVQLLNELAVIMETQLGIRKKDQYPPKNAPDFETQSGVNPGIPREPAPEKTEKKIDSAATLKSLFKFHLIGRKPAISFPQKSLENMTPAVLYTYRDLSRTRYDYPLCLMDDESFIRMTPLKEIFDNLLAKLADDSDQGRQIKKVLLKQEIKIKSLLKQNKQSCLLELWESAAQSMLKEFRLKKDQKEILKQQLSAARNSLTADGALIPDDGQAPLQILQLTRLLHWRRKTQSFTAEISELISKLKSILTLEAAKSREARSPAHLESSLGKTGANELDFEIFSGLLNRSAKGKTAPPNEFLSKKRRARIELILESLKKMLNYYGVSDETGGQNLKQNKNGPLSRETVSSVKEAVKIADSQLEMMTGFFKSVRIARLEVGNKYREEVHDPFFEIFKAEFLSSAEKSLFPSTILSLSASALSHSDRSMLLDLLSGNSPIKILLRIDDIYEIKNAQTNPVCLSNPAVNLAQLAINLNNAFVLQCPYSKLSRLFKELTAGLDYQGPALFSIYTGLPKKNCSLPLYLQSVSALESRAFPAFVFNPGAGENWAARFSITETSQYKCTWPENELSYLSGKDNKASTMKLKYTIADFLAADTRLSNHFLPVTGEECYENLTPVSEYLGLDQKSRSQKIPYILMVSEEGVLHRVITTRSIVAATAKIASFWNSLQELGGVNNSHTAKVLEQEKELMQSEFQEKVKAIQEEHQAKMAKTVEQLTQDIVAKIAAGLLNEGTLNQLPLSGGDFEFPEVNSPAPEAVKEEAPPAETVQEEPEEEESLSFDDPYIDTPLCTTCNDCTDINNRIFAYDDNKQAFVKDAAAGPFKDIVQAAEKCPVKIIHPGKPKNPDEGDLEELIKRAEPFN